MQIQSIKSQNFMTVIAKKERQSSSATETSGISMKNNNDVYITGARNSDVSDKEATQKVMTPDMAAAFAEKYDVKNMTRNDYGRLLQELRDSGVISSKDYSVGFGGAVPYTAPDGVQMTMGSAGSTGLDEWPSGKDKADFTKLLRDCARYCIEFASKQEEDSDGEKVGHSLADSYNRLLEVFNQISRATQQNH